MVEGSTEPCGLNGIPCFRCGVCCREFDVRVTAGEVTQIAGSLHLELEAFLQGFTYHPKYWSDIYLLKKVDEHCVFLEEGRNPHEFLCSIHAFKPSSCWQWTPSLDRRQCITGLQQYWKLTADASAQFTGSDQDLKAFKTYIEKIS
jgi:Fe-S-cluster containining protein